jgi:hypothetical protein
MLWSLLMQVCTAAAGFSDGAVSIGHSAPQWSQAM